MGVTYTETVQLTTLVCGRKRGRPPLPKGERRKSVLTLRLRPDDSKAIESAAAKAGQSMSEYVRCMLFDAKPEQGEQPDPLKKPEKNPIYWNWHGTIVLQVDDLTREKWEILSRFVAAMEPPTPESTPCP